MGKTGPCTLPPVLYDASPDEGVHILNAEGQALPNEVSAEHCGQVAHYSHHSPLPPISNNDQLRRYLGGFWISNYNAIFGNVTGENPFGETVEIGMVTMLMIQLTNSNRWLWDFSLDDVELAWMLAPYPFSKRNATLAPGTEPGTHHHFHQFYPIIYIPRPQGTATGDVYKGLCLAQLINGVRNWWYHVDRIYPWYRVPSGRVRALADYLRTLP